LGVGVYVYWDSYVAQCEIDSSVAWGNSSAYPEIGPTWAFVRRELPRGVTIAYANTYFTYPLMGYTFDHRVVYAPTRHGLERFVDMPRIDQRTTGEAIVGRVGTQGTIKGVLPDHVAATGSQIILANTYHLMLRPGEKVVAELGGLHKFMGWPGPILTDSGGFQVFSLADINRIDDDGVVFKSHIDGSVVQLTPARSMQVQN